MKNYLLIGAMALSMNVFANDNDTPYGGFLGAKNSHDYSYLVCVEKDDDKCETYKFVSRERLNRHITYTRLIKASDFKKIAKTMKKRIKFLKSSNNPDYLTGTMIGAGVCFFVKGALKKVGCTALVLPIGVGTDLISAPFKLAYQVGTAISRPFAHTTWRYKRWLKWMANPKKVQKDKFVNPHLYESLSYGVKYFKK